MNVWKVVLGIASVMLVSIPASAHDATTDQDIVHRAAAQYELDQLTAPISSPEDLRSHLQVGLHASPLRYLSQAGLRRFVSSLSFGENGVSGFSYEDIERELTATQAYELLSLIGQQQFTHRIRGLRVESGLDSEIMAGTIRSACEIPQGTMEAIMCDSFLDGYRCSDPGNCAESKRNACTSNC
ncbi:hypothetical protein E5843_08880 [Luteimonas yindakuii]|uniref:hypothetical protein n=1 Tax=Luteimonas yindakuii TaxID=2565782 RepID=UPI0010A4342B|nr:hypothetical protein [Luteimonas yindakuii]QCO67851.1 hypothetical protein E5843_08880 [Luteimonas yindakuii]